MRKYCSIIGVAALANDSLPRRKSRGAVFLVSVLASHASTFLFEQSVRGDTLSGGHREVLKEIMVFTDGAARGNPGPAAIAYAIFDSSDRCLEKEYQTIGKRTNNEAEYEALLWALDRAEEFTGESAKFHSDSELMVHQVNGVYKVKAEHLKLYVEQACEKARRFRHFKLVYLPRENPKIQLVDSLVNEALDKEGF